MRSTRCFLEVMASLVEKAQCVLWYHETKSPITVQRNFRRVYGGSPPDVKSIKSWYQKFSVDDMKRTGRPRTSEETVNAVHTSFQRSPSQSTRRAARELQVPQRTVVDILHKRLQFRAYKLQILQALHPNDRPQRTAFAEEILERIDADNDYLQYVAFSDEATFHVSGKVNRHNVRIWGSENPHAVIEHQRDSDKVNVWCCVMHDKIIGPFFFAESSISANIYLDMLTHYAVPQLAEFQPNIIFQQDGAPPHWGLRVREFLNEVFPNRWIGRDGPTP